MNVHPAAKLTKPPAWARSVAPPLGADGLPIPAESLERLLGLLATSAPKRPPLDLRVESAALDSFALAAFGWRLFEAWREAGFPAKHRWALSQIGFTGDDWSAARLALEVSTWRGREGSKRVLLGLEVFADIGTNDALLHLRYLAHASRFSNVRVAAEARLAEVARDRGWPRMQLDEGLPHLGLGAEGTVTLDFGPRQFEACLDPDLTLTVTADGKRRRSLPKALASDDAAKVANAQIRLDCIHQSVRAWVTLQVEWMELAMCSGRSWRMDAFRRLFVEDPLMRRYSARLVFRAVPDALPPTESRADLRRRMEETLVAGGKWTAESVRHFERDHPSTFQEMLRAFEVPRARPAELTFAVDDSGALIDPSGRPVELPPADLSIAHPVDVSAAELDGWRQALADEAVRQPFPQLDRVTWCPGDREDTLEPPGVTGGMARVGDFVREGHWVPRGGLPLAWIGPHGVTSLERRWGRHTVSVHVKPGIQRWSKDNEQELVVGGVGMGGMGVPDRVLSEAICSLRLLVGSSSD